MFNFTVCLPVSYFNPCCFITVLMLTLLLSDKQLMALYIQMENSKKQAYRSSTSANHRTMFRTYISFCLYFKLKDIDPSPSTLCLYIQMLMNSFSSPQSIHNYLSAVSLLHKSSGYQPPTHSYEVSTMLRAAKLIMCHSPNQRLPISPSILIAICDLCDMQGPIGLVAKCAYLTAFFTFIRQSNIVPSSHSLFDHTKHAARGDLFFSPPGAVLLIKWSKTLQTGQHTLLPIPAINRHRHCPVAAFKQLFRAHPLNPNQPLFPMPDVSPPRSITVSMLRDILNINLKILGINPTQYSLHSFRRGGATTAYQAGADYAHIKRHGTWRSNVFWDYITTYTQDSHIPQALASTFKTSI